MTAFLDLFSGIGGFALAAYWAGLRFDRHYFSEIDGYAVKVYKNHFPDAENLGDIRNVDYGKLPRAEWLVTAGFPCQPHSDAGLKKGADDKRDLWPECRRMLRDLRPRIALFENVRGLLTSPGRERKGEFFNGVLSDIYACGYDAEWQVISAADAGAPHLRKRVWIVCYASESREGRETEKPQRLRETMAYAQKQYRPVERHETPIAGRSGQALADTESERRGDGNDGAYQGQADRKINAFADAGIPRGEKRWPTPVTPRPHDSENTAGKYMPGQKQKSLEGAVAANGGQLNPTWLEWLQGYPLGWTDLKDSGIVLSLSAPK
jgi:site-specific DNA-cytosine methylase